MIISCLAKWEEYIKWIFRLNKIVNINEDDLLILIILLKRNRDKAEKTNDISLKENILYPKKYINIIWIKWKSIFILWGCLGYKLKKLSVEKMFFESSIFLDKPPNQDSSEWTKGNLVKKNTLIIIYIPIKI